jgi:hypothetical protein
MNVYCEYRREILDSHLALKFESSKDLQNFSNIANFSTETLSNNRINTSMEPQWTPEIFYVNFYPNNV